jgi:hypothetical protein
MTQVYWKVYESKAWTLSKNEFDFYIYVYNFAPNKYINIGFLIYSYGLELKENNHFELKLNNIE